MIAIVHPLADELGGLVEAGPLSDDKRKDERDGSWMWMVWIVLGIGALAWLTR